MLWNFDMLNAVCGTMTRRGMKTCSHSMAVEILNQQYMEVLRAQLTGPTPREVDDA